MFFINFSFFVVLFCILILLATLLPVDLEPVMGPFRTDCAGPPSGFADDKSWLSPQKISPSSASVVHPLCLPIPVIMLQERGKKSGGFVKTTTA